VIAKKVKDGFFGLCVGEALGLPVDCRSREYLQQFPVTELEGYGTYNLPPGIWSDGSSLTFCTAEALITGFNLEQIAENFILWRDTGYWTPNGEIVGKWNPTTDIVDNLKQRVRGALIQSSTGNKPTNFALLWVLPFAYVTYGLEPKKRVKTIREAVNLIDGNPVSAIGAVFYVELAVRLLEGKNIRDAVVETQEFMQTSFKDAYELNDFSKLTSGKIISLTEEELRASNTLIDTLTVVVWTLLKSNNYREAVLAAVNLGEDTDAVGAVTGGLAGLAFGYESIPGDWVEQMARKEDITQLIDKFTKKMRSWETQLKSGRTRAK